MSFSSCMTSQGLIGKIPSIQLKRDAGTYEKRGLDAHAAMLRAVEDKLTKLKLEEKKIIQSVRQAYEADGGKRPAPKQDDFGDVPFSRTKPFTGLSVEQVRQAIANDPINKIIDVYATMDDLPHNIKVQAEREGADDVEGFYDDTTNRVGIVADNLSSPERAIAVARHELIGHYGIENMLADSADPGEMARLIKRVIAAEKNGNETIIELAKHVDATQPGIDAQRRAKEIMAVMAERNIQNSIAKRVIDAIRTFLHKLGVIKSDTTDVEIAAMLREAQAYLREQGRSVVAGQGVAAFARAYHGSPHRFDKFSLDHIGRGEGAQAYGWGLYFTDKRAIAEHYRKGLTNKQFINMAREAYDEYYSPDEAVDALKEIDGLSDAQKELIDALQEDDWLGYDYPHQAISAVFREPESFELSDRTKEALAKQGQLYEVEIPDDHEYLLWDKPLSEQPRQVKEALANAEVKNRSGQDMLAMDPTGEEIIRALGKDESASQYLHSLGIAGIKYLDGTSRDGKGDGFNYVVFDDSRVKVERTHYSRAGQQAELNVAEEPAKNPITLKDLGSTERDVSGRRRWVAGQKAYDKLSDAIQPLLAKVQLSNDAPAAFKDMMRQFQVDQQKAMTNARRVAEVGTQTLSAEERVLISDIIEKNLIGDIPPENVAKIATDIEAALKQQAQDLVELGMATEDRLLENYLPRAYRNPLLARITSKEQFVSWYQKAKLRMNGNRLKSRGMVDTVALKDIAKYKKLGWHISAMADGENMPQDLLDALNHGQTPPSQYATKDMKVLMWRDFTADERAKMGEIRDGILRYAMGYTDTQRDIAIGRLFKAIAENDELSSKVNPGGWTRVPDQDIPGTPLKRYGALSGLFVPPYVRDVIERSTQPKGPLMQMYDKALSFWKEGKTVWNPVSHGNNVVSNVFVMHFAGLNPADPRPWRSTVREYRTKGQYYQEAVDNGLFGVEFASKNIQELFLPDLSDDLDVETVVASRFNKMVEFLKKTGKPIAWYRENMQKAYEFEDQFFKLMLYADRRKNGASIEDAIQDTERYIFNYSDIPEGVEKLKRFYSPFFSYTYKAIPMVLHTAMTRPDRLLLPIALLGGANWLAYALMGGDEDDERKGMPEYMQGRTAIGTQKAIRMPFNIGERPAYMDISRRVPLGDLFDMTNQTGGAAVPAPLMPSHPVFTATLAMLFNMDSFTGKDLVKKSDTNWEAAQVRADWLWKQMAPNAPFVPGTWNFDKLMNGMANAFDTDMAGYTGYTKSGDATPLGTALLDVAGGTKIRSFDPARGKDFQQYGLDKERKEIQANIRSAMRNKAMTPDARREYVTEQQDKLKELAKQKEALH